MGGVYERGYVCLCACMCVLGGVGGGGEGGRMDVAPYWRTPTRSATLITVDV